MAQIFYDRTPESMLEVELKSPDDFLKVKETLTRSGVASKKEKKLYQSCHILHKQGKYFIVNFKEMFCLDGKYSSITPDDIERRNAISLLLEEWGLLKVVKPFNVDPHSAIAKIKIIPFREKSEWILEPKYTIGKK